MSAVVESEVVSGHWDEQFETGVRSSWFSYPAVLSELNRRVTGRDAFWLSWVLQEYLTERLERVLSIGCGDGAHELMMARHNFVGSVDAFDLSPAGIEKAEQEARADGLNAHFRVRDFDDFIANPGGNYDAVFFIGSLHHVKDLEGMLAAARKSLRRDGYLIISEYVGPCYNIYPDDRITIINDTLELLEPIFKTRPDARWTNPTIETVYSIDPSESVRSELIPPFLKFYFEPELIRPMGGALMHPLADHLNSAKLNDGSAESKTIVRMLIQMESQLEAAGKLPSDFMVGIYRNTKLPPLPSATLNAPGEAVEIDCPVTGAEAAEGDHASVVAAHADRIR